MSLHDDLTRVIEDARDHSRKNFNVVKESYGQYLARAILASDVIDQVRAEALTDLEPGDLADLLREHDERVWDEGWSAAGAWQIAAPGTSYPWNPYREERDRG